MAQGSIVNIGKGLSEEELEDKRNYGHFPDWYTERERQLKALDVQ